MKDYRRMESAASRVCGSFRNWRPDLEEQPEEVPAAPASEVPTPSAPEPPRPKVNPFGKALERHPIRNHAEAEQLLDQGVLKMGEGLGFIDPSKVREDEEDEYEAQGGMYRPIPGLGRATLELLVSCAFHDPRWIGGAAWARALRSREDFQGAVEAIETNLAEILATGNRFKEGRGTRAGQAFLDGLAMVDAVRAWLVQQLEACA